MTPKIRSLLTWFAQPLHFFVTALACIPLLLVLIFAFIHRQDFPRNEEFAYTYPMAVAYQDNGSVDPALFFERVGDLHLSVVPLVVLYLSVVLADWSVDFELMLMTPFILASFLMLVGLFYKSDPQGVVWILIPFSMLFFAVHQDVNWYIGYYVAGWHLPAFFFLLALSLIEWFPDRLWSLVLAAASCVLSMVSLTPGILSWLLIGAYLPFSDHRKKPYLMAWGVAAVVLLAVYLYEPLQSASEGVRPTAFGLYNPGYQLRYFLARLGSSLVSRLSPGSYIDIVSLAAVIAVGGILLLLVNAVLVWRLGGNFRRAARWLAVAGYGIGTALLITLSNLRSEVILRAFISWYDTAIGLFWIALAAMIALAVGTLLRNQQPESLWKKAALYGNLSIAAGLATLYVLQNQRIEATGIFSDNPDNRATGTPVTDSCAKSYVYSLEPACLGEYVDYANKLAVRRLAIYARSEPIDVLPPEYSAGEPVMVVTRDAWGSAHARDWVLAEVDAGDLLFVFAGEVPSRQDLPRPPEPHVDSGGLAAADVLLDRMAQPDRFWLVYPAVQPVLTSLMESLALAGYVETMRTDGSWVVILYVRD